MIKKRAVVLLNLGTPDSPNTQDVRRYLREFLMDPYVLDIPYIFRWFLVHALILPKRPKASAEAYQKIWTDRGSPLLFHLNDLVEKVQKSLGETWIVKPTMRYGNPSIAQTFNELRSENVSELLIFPLYPQFSLAATESSFRECERLLKKLNWNVPVKEIKSFYDDDFFIQSFVDIIRDSLRNYTFDHILFSFHGLPERQIRKTDPTGEHCFANAECCNQISEKNKNCYRAQCFETARLIAKKMNLVPGSYSVCFQSRLGSTPWIQPFTDVLYHQLAKQGVKRLAVVCPSFVSDCLETLEEIQIRGRNEFIQYGGEDLKLVPSLNSSEMWVKAIDHLVTAP